MAISLLNGRSYIPGMTYNPQGQSTGVMGQLTGGSVSAQPYTGISPTIRANQASMGYLAPGYKPPTTPVSGQMTWDQWAQNMQNQYGTGNGGTLGGTANSSGSTPIAPPDNKNTPAGGGGTGYGAGYTGYGNSVMAGPSPTSTTTSGSTASHPLTATGNPNYNSGQVPVAPPNPTNGGGMNGLQQLINTPQVGVAPPDPNRNVSAANNPNPFANVSSNPYPNSPTPTVPTPIAPLSPINSVNPLVAPWVKPGSKTL